MKTICDDPFSGDYVEVVIGFGKFEYVGRGECGMGGPTRGRLLLDDVQICCESLPSCAIDQKRGRIVFLEINLIGSPRIIARVIDKQRNEIQNTELDFGAYSVEFKDSDTILLRDAFTRLEQKLEIRK